MGQVGRSNIKGYNTFHKWGELVIQVGAVFFKVGRVGEKVGRLGVGRLASGATCHGFVIKST